jgi:hypothetical protein
MNRTLRENAGALRDYLMRRVTRMPMLLLLAPLDRLLMLGLGFGLISPRISFGRPSISAGWLERLRVAPVGDLHSR